MPTTEPRPTVENERLLTRARSLRDEYGDCPDCGRELLVSSPADDRIHHARPDALPLLLHCTLRERALHQHVYPGEGDGASAYTPACDWTRVVGWLER